MAKKRPLVEDEETNATPKTPSAAGGPSKQTELLLKPISKPNKETPNKPSADTSRADEIAFLNGIIRYISETGCHPSSDLASFFDYISKMEDVPLTVSSKGALGNKVRRLRNKYMVEKDAEGSDSEFLNLGEKIWGNNPNEPSSSLISKRVEVKKGKEKENREADVVMEEEEREDGEEEMWKKYPRVFASIVSSIEEAKVLGDVTALKEECMEAMKEIDEKKLKLWESRWEQHKRVELQEFVKKSGLMTEQLKDVLGFLKSR